MKIKVCGMRDPQNIAELARLKPDYMGFIFYGPSPRYAGELQPDDLKTLSGQTRRVGVFVDAAQEHIRSMAQKFDLDFIQLHGQEPPQLCIDLRKDYGVIKSFGISDKQDIYTSIDYEGTCDYYIFDTKTSIHGGSGLKFDHAILTTYTGATPYLLSGGLSVEDAASLASFNHNCCAGFDINSRFETAPGLKDNSLVKTFIETIKNAKR